MKIVLITPKYKIAPLVIGILLTVQTNYAQQLTMSSMGILENTSSLSAAINFKSNAKCIDVQSGIAVVYNV